MPDKFIPLAEGFWVSPQIHPEDVEAAKALGVALIVNNRPDGEQPGQPTSVEIERAARAAGLSYVAIPVRGMQIGAAELDAFDAALESATGGVLAYCRSGTRSTMLRALARARAGAEIDAIIEEAVEAGYDISSQRRALEAAARR